MINILISRDNSTDAIKLMNDINQASEKIKVCSIVKSGNEVLEIINNKNNIDIIVLDDKTIFDGKVLIFDKIADKNRYYKSIIVLSKNNELKNYPIIYEITNPNTVIEKVNELVRNKEAIKNTKNYRKKIINEVLYLGYDISQKGTQYLIQVIEYILLNPYKNVEVLEKDIYPQIAKLYHDTVHNVKCRINSSTTAMYCNCSVERLKDYFNFSVDVKPRVKTIVNTITNKML